MDQLATSSWDFVETNTDLPSQEFCAKVRILIKKEWQSQWYLEVGNRLHFIRPSLVK